MLISCTNALIFTKPHTNACIACECMFIELTIYCNCYNVSRGTWCASERVSTDLDMNLLTMRDCVLSKEGSYTISCSVGMED